MAKAGTRCDIIAGDDDTVTLVIQAAGLSPAEARAMAAALKDPVSDAMKAAISARITDTSTMRDVQSGEVTKLVKIS